VNRRTLNCPRCFHLLAPEELNRPDMQPCPGCQRSLLVEVFPAYFRLLQPGRAGESIVADGEAGCFYHPQKRAAVPCDSCGRFLCALCDCEMNGKHWCPACLEAGKSRGKIQQIEAGRTRYDSIALAVAVYPLLIFYFTILSAPIALYLVVRHWNTPRGLTAPSRARLVIAGTVALIELGAWTAFFIMLWSK
jgi:hypothetical protein